MSLEKLVERIINDAKDKANKIILESEKKAEEIKKAARKEALKLAEELEKEAERQGHLEASRLITQERLEKKMDILSCKKELIGEVLDRAFRKAGLEKKEIKRKIIMKDGELEEPYDEEKLREEIRSKLENEIVEILKI